MNELAQTLSSLGGDALTAFILVQVLDTIEVLVFFSLLTWGIRTLWKQGIQKYIDRDFRE